MKVAMAAPAGLSDIGQPDTVPLLLAPLVVLVVVLVVVLPLEEPGPVLDDVVEWVPVPEELWVVAVLVPLPPLPPPPPHALARAAEPATKSPSPIKFKALPMTMRDSLQAFVAVQRDTRVRLGRVSG
jgi:hypothetical protein